MNAPMLYCFEANDYPLDPGLRLLEASAGTGKTFALAHIVLRLLTERQLKLRQLLVVTFTDAAAAELRNRISNRLAAALTAFEAMEQLRTPTTPDSILAEWIERYSKNLEHRHRWIGYLLEALGSLDHADITTIHGFCHRTLCRQALSSGGSFKLVLEEDSQERIGQIVHNYWQQQVLQLPSEDIEGLLNAKLNISSLARVLHQLDQRPNLQPPESTDLEGELEPIFRSELRHRLRCFKELWHQDSQELEQKLRSHAASWRARGAKNISPFYVTQSRRKYCDEVDHWLASESDPGYGSVRRLETLGSFLHPGVFCRVARRCGEQSPSLPVSRLQKAVANLWDGPAELAWRHAVHHCWKQLQKQRYQDGVMTFAELLLKLDLVRQKTSWLSSLRNRYRVALIDEFQDTDPVQWRLMQTIFAESSEHLLLMVGDPKQAIYRFRGGDLSTYFAAREQVHRCDILVKNFRASTPLVEGLNAFMAPGMRRSQLAIPEVTPQGDIRPIKYPGSHPLELILLDTKNIEDRTLLPSCTTLSECIPGLVARRAVQLLENDKHLTLQDLCVLVSTHRQAEEVRNALAHVGLPSRLTRQGDILASEAAAILQCFLNALACPNEVSCLRLLAISPLLEWSLEELKQADDNGKLSQLSEQMYRWRRLMPQIGLLGCLNGFLDGRVFANFSRRNHLLSDVHQCAQLVQLAMYEQGLSTTAAMSWLQRQRRYPRYPAHHSRQPHSDIAEYAVSVVTIHHSKGLEYPVVFCPYLWQAPPAEHGPVWCQSKDANGNTHLTLALNTDWGRGYLAKVDSEEQRCKESERLAYVALTRAKQMVILFWGHAVNQEKNPLVNWLFSGEDYGLLLKEQSSTHLQEILERRNVPISFLKASSLPLQLHWRPPLLHGKPALGPVPERPLDYCWGHGSYSAWVDKSRDLNGGNAGLQDRDSSRNGWATSSLQCDLYPSDGEDCWDTQGPLGEFPRGASAGECLHRILEHLSFGSPSRTTNALDLIHRELARAGLKAEWAIAVQKGLDRILTTPLLLSGNEFKQSLADLSEGQLLRELKFNLPVAHHGSPLRAADVAACFCQDPNHSFAVEYANQVASLSFISRGFLTGSIDLIICDREGSHNSRWWVLDWKSNWIGVRDSTGIALACGPRHYSRLAMEAQMLQHHYPLQAHLYLVALHRYLSWRLANYQPERNLGGYVYAFLRGMPGKINLNPKLITVPGVFAEPAPVKRILALDNLLQKGR